MTLAKVKVTYFKVKCWKWAKNKDWTFFNSSHLMDIVHFQDLSLTFDSTDPYLYFDISYDAFQLSFPWLRNSDTRYSISQKLMNRGKNWTKMPIFLYVMHAVQLKPMIITTLITVPNVKVTNFKPVVT